MGARSTASHEDAIRVVPVHGYRELAELANDAPPQPAPRLTYRGGPLLTAVEVFTIFWGEEWQQAPLSELIDPVNAFFETILQSELIDQLAEYSVDGQAIGRGSFVGTKTLTAPAPGPSVADSTLQQVLQEAIDSDPDLPKPGENLLYFVYLPSGVTISQGGDRSCQAFCGYHNDIGGEIFYAAMPYPGCMGCSGGLSTLDALTSTSSHELCEAITDAIPGQGWYDDVHGEIGDICAWQTRSLSGYMIQLEWSNKAEACM
jgi:hypothetical protein